MLSRARIIPGALAPILALLWACGGGGGSTHHSSGPRTNIDLSMADFSVTPAAADPEDQLTVSGTIQNIGTETANPELGDKFYVRFNLSQDGTFELNEQGFLEKPISDPIPPGGSLPFTYTAPYGGGDTLSFFGNFCNCASPDCCTLLPQTGVIGVKLDSAESIKEVEEGNNFQFKPIQVVGTRVAATAGGCDTGVLNNPNDGCNLIVSDGFFTTQLHRPCAGCTPNEIVMPNELYRVIYVTLQIKGCTKNQTPSGFCGMGWTIIGTTSKPGMDPSTKTIPLTCIAAYCQSGCPDAACSYAVEIRDPDY